MVRGTCPDIQHIGERFLQLIKINGQLLNCQSLLIAPIVQVSIGIWLKKIDFKGRLIRMSLGFKNHLDECLKLFI